MPNHQEATVTLSIENWEAIIEIIRLSCQSRGNDWVRWGKGINEIIQSSIDEVLGKKYAIQRVAIHSDNINSIGYDPHSRILEIQYDDGNVYQYYEVPQLVYTGLINAESKWGFINRNVKARFGFKNIGIQPLLHAKKKSFRTYEDDFDYGDEPAENYTLSDLQSDLGMALCLVASLKIGLRTQVVIGIEKSFDYMSRRKNLENNLCCHVKLHQQLRRPFGYSCDFDLFVLRVDPQALPSARHLCLGKNC